jgi:molybdenum cofactor biosynthesis enzyme
MLSIAGLGRSFLQQSTLSHVSDDGTRPRMVDVGAKLATKRVAQAAALVSLPRAIFEPHLRRSVAAAATALTVADGTTTTSTTTTPARPPPLELVGKKGPVFSTAIIAGVMGAKNTSSMMPFCHPLPLESCDVDIDVVGDDDDDDADDDAAAHNHRRAPAQSDRLLISIRTAVSCTHKTGVEMEALTAASCAALCIYDMCKALSHDIVISDIRLVHKSGGKSDVGGVDSR